MFSNVVSFRVYSKSKLSLKSSRDDSDVFSVVAMGLEVFAHLLDVHVPVSKRRKHTLIALGQRGDHPFTDVLCLTDLSFPSLVQK